MRQNPELFLTTYTVRSFVVSHLRFKHRPGVNFICIDTHEITTSVDQYLLCYWNLSPIDNINPARIQTREAPLFSIIVRQANIGYCESHPPEALPLAVRGLRIPTGFREKRWGTDFQLFFQVQNCESFNRFRKLNGVNARKPQIYDLCPFARACINKYPSKQNEISYLRGFVYLDRSVIFTK